MRMDIQSSIVGYNVSIDAMMSVFASQNHCCHAYNCRNIYQHHWHDDNWIMGIGLPEHSIGTLGIYIAYMSSFVILGGAIIYTLTNMLSDSDVGSSLWTLCIPSMIMLYMVYG